MKSFLKLIVCFLLLAGCSKEDNNLLEDIAFRGGFIQFSEVPILEFNLTELANARVSEGVIDPNNNATNYSLDLIYNDVIVNGYITLTSFPNTLEIDVSDALQAVGLAMTDVTADTILTFVATVETPNGTFSGLSPDFDDDNVNQGGNSTPRLKEPGLRDAIEFDITFF
mgnify:CR=1 FL=1